MVEILKVSSKSNPNSVAGALAGVVRGSGSVEMQVVGAGALNQAVKALAIARGYVAHLGIDLACRPTFADIEIDGDARTAIRLLVEGCGPLGDGSGTGPGRQDSRSTRPAQVPAVADVRDGSADAPPAVASAPEPEPARALGNA